METRIKRLNGISWENTVKPPQSVTKISLNDRSSIAFYWEYPSPSSVFPNPWGGEADVSLALPRLCPMRDQEPAPSIPWSRSAYWTQVLESVLPRASPVRPCIPGPVKRRLSLRDLEFDCGPRVYPFPTIPNRSSTPRTQFQEEKRVAPSPPEEQSSQKGKDS